MADEADITADRDESEYAMRLAASGAFKIAVFNQRDWCRRQPPNMVGGFVRKQQRIGLGMRVHESPFQKRL